MTVFAQAIADVVADANFGRNAIYTPASTSVPMAVRVVAAGPSLATDVIGVRIVTPETMRLRVLTADVPKPEEGDVITLDGIDHMVQGVPVADDLRLVWTLDTRPA